MSQNSTIMPPKKHYYAGIMLNAPHIVLCSKLCRHNVSTPTRRLHLQLQTVFELYNDKIIGKPNGEANTQDEEELQKLEENPGGNVNEAHSDKILRQNGRFSLWHTSQRRLFFALSRIL